MFIIDGKCSGCEVNEIPITNDAGDRVCFECKPNEIPALNTVTEVYQCDVCPEGEMPFEGSFPLACVPCPMKVLLLYTTSNIFTIITHYKTIRKEIQ